MPDPASFDYAVLRIVPRVEREEFINAGVVLFSRQHRYLGARVHLNADRCRALFPDIDCDLVQRHLDAVLAIVNADPNAGPIAQLPQRDRFGWLVAPRSTIVQVSPTHTGICENPEAALERLFQQLVS